MRALGGVFVGLAVTPRALAEPVPRAPQPPPKAAATRVASYVARKPAPDTQVQTSAADRGINPCMDAGPRLRGVRQVGGGASVWVSSSCRCTAVSRRGVIST